MFDKKKSQGKSPTQIAKELGVHVASVYRWIYTPVRGRKLKSYLVGGRRRVFQEDLETFINGEETSAKEIETSRHRKAQHALASFGVRSQKDEGPRS